MGEILGVCWPIKPTAKAPKLTNRKGFIECVVNVTALGRSEGRSGVSSCNLAFYTRGWNLGQTRG